MAGSSATAVAAKPCSRNQSTAVVVSANNRSTPAARPASSTADSNHAPTESPPDQARQLGIAVAELVQGATARERAVEFRDEELSDVSLDAIASAPDQHTGVLERSDQLHDRADIGRRGATDYPIVTIADLGARSLGGEQFLEQHPVFGEADEMCPVNASPTGFRQRREPSSGDGVERVARNEVGQSARGEIAALGYS